MLENIRGITSANYLENNGGKLWAHQSFFPLYPEKFGILAPIRFILQNKIQGGVFV